MFKSKKPVRWKILTNRTENYFIYIPVYDMWYHLRQLNPVDNKILKVNSVCGSYERSYIIR